MKPPKKNYTLTSNRNSSSDSSFASLGNLGVNKALQEQYNTPNHLVRGSFDVKSNHDFIHNTAQNVLRKQDSACDGVNMNATLDPNMGDYSNKGSKVMPSSLTNMMTMQSHYRSKVPVTTKKLKKKDTNSTATFRKMMAVNGSYLTVAPGEGMKTSKNKSSRSRLKTVDSKGKLISINNSKNFHDGSMVDANDRPSSGKKKKSSKKQTKSKHPHDFTQRTYNNSKDMQNKVRFHPLSKDTSVTMIRKSMNF